MRYLVLICLTALPIAACSPLRTATPEPVITAPIPAMPSATNAAATLVPTQPVPVSTPTAPAANAEPVTLQVLSPQDDVIVSTQKVIVTGTASPGAVVTVNDDILIAGPDGKWQDTVTLTEGLNLIEIIASNTSGSEASIELTVTYEP